MKEHGFTLVELLAVIVILGLIALISVPAIMELIKDSKEGLAEDQKKSIELAAKNWASDEKNITKLPKTDKSICVNISTLQSGGYLDLDVKNPATGKAYTVGHVEIERKNKRLTYSVDVDADGVDCVE